MRYEVIETCPHCDSEVILENWDVDIDGWETTCPFCGNHLILCSECRDLEVSCGNCDWDEKTGLCHMCKNFGKESK